MDMDFLLGVLFPCFLVIGYFVGKKVESKRVVTQKTKEFDNTTPIVEEIAVDERKEERSREFKDWCDGTFGYSAEKALGTKVRDE